MWYVKKYKPERNKGTRVVSRKEAKIIHKIFETKEVEIARIEDELNEIESGCDSRLPFIITIKHNDVSSNTYNLDRFSNCYPASTRHFMSLLEELFDD